ncbi:UPF0182 family protein [Bifidobacterium gallicum]|uniref:UPF0182 protein BGLCM_1468 n=1 Tax=Bifidobacterium gallicum DSM 20093 = LMG 11596 TaxID=561180 RepID=D1NS42_9BIFI|nr:UPF0182 family protein [Bifidobacterium gallicum]EFA23494.1 hypothetical protein BIFGAL_02596 [Bifidobacterium gallicum DSM 20093 = LMG 11596]KFI57224.1 hypothetical protein BGLCM_1468 [Bifidobacterium gallicum DSM 20093 = LMG 11596]
MSFFNPFDMFSPGNRKPAGKRGQSQPADDEPIIINVQTAGEEDSSNATTNPSGHTGAGGPRGPQGPRLTSRRSPNPHHSGRGTKIFLGIVLALVVIVGLFFALSRFITDVMWYGQLGFSSIIWTQLGTRVGLWIVYVLLMAAVGYVSATLAIRTRPDFADGSTIRINGDVIEIGKSVSSKSARRVAVVAAIIVGLIAGSRFNIHWSELLLMFNTQSFGTTDPVFGLDTGFYVFVLPGLRLIMGEIGLLFVVGLVFSVIAHVMVGGIRFTMPVNGHGIVALTRHARRQIAVWMLLAMLMWAANQVMGVFSTLTQTGDRITGATYTTVHATIPVTFIIAGLTVVTAIVLFVWLLRTKSLSESSGTIYTNAATAWRAWRVPVITVASALVLALLMATIWPMVMQRFRVNPNAQEVESTYIQRNIDATRAAYGLDSVQTSEYQATTKGEAGALSKETETTAQIRLLDPQIVSPTFKQLQQLKQYYTFADTLAVDKYDIDGTNQDTVIAAREINLNGNDNRNWVNDHTVYTHGYGIVAAYGNKVTADGQPEFFEYGIPTQGYLTQTQHYEPRIYFSPEAPEYSIVGAPQGTTPWEFDYPTGSEGATTTFTGNGGPSLGNIFSRLLYAVRFGSDQILFSDRVNADSQILYDRSPKERVAKVAPYLTLDGRVYPAVVNGRVKWIIDGYTTSDQVPYSQKTDLASATEDSTTVSSDTVHSLNKQQVNYMRNSVKATVDAYDGSVDLYAWDVNDPVLKAWRQIFPGQYHDISEISGDLMAHLRYPEGIFKVQRQLLAKYHVTSANQFFSGEDFWQTPVDPTEPSDQQSRRVLQPPYYLTLQTGGSEEPVFSLTSSYIPAGSSTREILTGFLSVDSDAGRTKGVIGPDYGTIRLQELPKDSNVPGPGQAQNNFNANADVSKELNLLQSGSTQVERGNLLTLPLGGGLVYVEPVYVKSSGSTSYPLLKKVLVAFGDQVGFANTLDEALNQVFGGDSGASAGDASNAGSSTPATPSESTGSSGSSGSSSSSTIDSSGTSPDLKAALQDASQAMKDSDAAMKKGDWGAYGEAQKRLQEALDKAVKLGE